MTQSRAYDNNNGPAYDNASTRYGTTSSTSTSNNIVSSNSNSNNVVSKQFDNKPSLFIGNLPFDTTADELARFIENNLGGNDNNNDDDGFDNSNSKGKCKLLGNIYI